MDTSRNIYYIFALSEKKQKRKRRPRKVVGNPERNQWKNVGTLQGDTFKSGPICRDLSPRLGTPEGVSYPSLMFCHLRQSATGKKVWLLF